MCCAAKGAPIAARDLTQGSISRHILTLAAPVVGALMLQSVYALVDLGFVRQLGEASVAGLSISFQVFFVILALGKVVGTTLLSRVSQLIGQNEFIAARDIFTRYSIIAVVIGICAAIGAFLGGSQYVGWFSDDPAVLSEGIAYFRVMSATFFLQMMLMVFGDAVRASGDFITPMKLMAASVTLNLVLDPILIFGLGPIPALGIAGAAWATVLSQILPFGLYVRRFLTPQEGRNLCWRRGGEVTDVFRELALRGLPAGLQFILISSVLGVALWAMKPHGAAWTATAGGGFRVIQQVFLPIVAVASASAAIAGQNLGAGLPSRVREVCKTALLWTMIYGVITTVVLFYGGEWAGRLFLKDPEWYPIAGTYFRWSAWLMLTIPATMLPSFILQAAGRAVLPASAAVARVMLLMAAVYWLLHYTEARPEWIFGATTGTALLEGGLNVFLLRRFLGRLPEETA